MSYDIAFEPLINKEQKTKYIAPARNRLLKNVSKKQDEMIQNDFAKMEVRDHAVYTNSSMLRQFPDRLSESTQAYTPIEVQGYIPIGGIAVGTGGIDHKFTETTFRRKEESATDSTDYMTSERMAVLPPNTTREESALKRIPQEFQLKRDTNQLSAAATVPNALVYLKQNIQDPPKTLYRVRAC
ncbi:UNVERIFIED_CONTAM: hypothetical protein HDU68_012295 [Siphonaria sp. JEL0065]|nr:hypothetical protein HDU68_012295 [Siphonaria sp. JEL0065]